MINIFILCGAYLLNSATNPTLPISFPRISRGSPPMRPHMPTSNCHFFSPFHHQSSAPMPGTIQVSVVGLMDLPKPETSTSSFTLKVAMGKREYQSMGQGDCSVPVVSIRDRLIVAIHDVEGNEIFQTEFRTMSVVENEVMEGSYPLRSGGYVNMKLQFSLSEEEHARIREMRESALKRKCMEQLQTETKDSDSVQKKGNWITYSLSGEGSHLDRSPRTDPDTSGSPGATSIQVSEEPSEDPFEIGGGQLIEARKENVEVQTPRSLVPGDATKHSNYDPSTLKENQENKTRSSVRKMVTALESSKFQGPEPLFGPRMISSSCKVGVEGSLRDELKVPQDISKSFSSGMLSDMNSQQSSMLFRSSFLKKQEEMEHVGPAERWETIGKGKVSLEPKTDKNVKSHGSVEQKGVRERAHSAEAAASVRFTEKEGEFLKKNFKETEEILNLAVISKDDKISDMQTVSETSDERTSSSSEVDSGSRYNAAADISSRREHDDVGNEQSISVNVALSQKVKPECARKEVLIPRKVLDKSSSINRPGSPNTCQQVSVLVATTQQNESECPESHSEREIVSSPPNGGADLLTYFGDDGCSLENHDVWDTRRLCLTTGTSQLRDLADCHTRCRGTYPIEQISSVGSSYQDGDTSIEDDENGRSSHTSIEPNPENSLGITKPNSGLIEQVVRIAILVVACGTLLLNTIHRNPK